MNLFKFLKQKKPKGIYAIAPKDMTEEMAREYLHQEMEALKEMETRKKEEKRRWALGAMTQSTYIGGSGSGTTGSVWIDHSGNVSSGSSQYLAADGTAMTWAAPAPTTYTESRVQYISHLYNMVYEAENTKKETLVDNAFWQIHNVVREAFHDETTAIRVGRKLNLMLEKLAEITLDREYLKEERLGPIMGDEETHDEFNREQTILNRLVENYFPKEVRSLTVYNKKEREMFMKDITQISNCVKLIVSDKKGDQNAGKELIKSLAVG